jgi:hypothetical protein
MALLLDSEFLTRTELTALRHDLVTSVKGLSREWLQENFQSGVFDIYLCSKAASWQLIEQREVLILGLMNRASMTERVQRSLAVIQSNELPADLRTLVSVIQFLVRVEFATGVLQQDAGIVPFAAAGQPVGPVDKIQAMVNEALMLEDPVARVVCLSLLREKLRMTQEKSEVSYEELYSAQAVSENEGARDADASARETSPANQGSERVARFVDYALRGSA